MRLDDAARETSRDPARTVSLGAATTIAGDGGATGDPALSLSSVHQRSNVNSNVSLDIDIVFGMGW
jgi:hypothetical protein